MRGSTFTAIPREPTILSSAARAGRRGNIFLEVTEDIGPGVITGAADDDPSGIATYSQAGAHFGYTLLWTIPLTYPLLAAVQLVSAHVGRVTGAGLAKNLAAAFPQPVVSLLVTILVTANIFNIGADLSAMAASAELVAGGGGEVFAVFFAVLCAGLQVFVPYRQYAHVLKWLTLSLFAYVGVVLLVHVDWHDAVIGFVWPSRLDAAALLTVVAVFGTTISPYLFFWQSSQEAEEIATSHERPLKDAPRAVSKQYRRMRVDTLLGMAFAHMIALAIMLATAATLHVKGAVDINSAAEAAEALRPIAGHFTSLLFAIGVIGTGLLAVPVLAGSAAFAVGETHGWKTGLEFKPHQAKRFPQHPLDAIAARRRADVLRHRQAEARRRAIGRDRVRHQRPARLANLGVKHRRELAAVAHAAGLREAVRALVHLLRGDERSFTAEARRAQRNSGLGFCIYSAPSAPLRYQRIYWCPP